MSLKDRLAAQIAASGPLTVAQYMQACLHDPADGYYATRPAIGEEGDFITAPMVSQMFGEMIGLWAVETWRGLGAPTPFRLVEGLPNLVVKNPITGAFLDVTPALAVAKEFRQSVNDLNASITYALEMGLEFSVWGRNLLDDRMIRQIFDSPAQIGSISGYPNQPRTYGASVRYRF